VAISENRSEPTPISLLADPGFSADDLRQRLDDQGVRIFIPPQSGRRWPTRFGRRLFRQRQTVGDLFTQIKRCRQPREERFMRVIRLRAELRMKG
jgi:hypothetical protein